YVTHNFSQFMKLAFWKSIAFWGLYRGYFSTAHNSYLIIYFYPLFLLSILSFGFWIRKEIFKFIYLASIVGLNWLTVILSCDDWHNRFLLILSPYFIILSLGFIVPIFIRKRA
ncbi:MAG TPA: hypothetical protein VFV08_01255, partial [Puia sp.]|nr:hypothetical protein [Puia sp.]